MSHPLDEDEKYVRAICSWQRRLKIPRQFGNNAYQAGEDFLDSLNKINRYSKLHPSKILSHHIHQWDLVVQFWWLL